MSGGVQPKALRHLGKQFQEAKAVGAVAEIFLRSLLRPVAWQRPPTRSKGSGRAMTGIVRGQ